MAGCEAQMTVTTVHAEAPSYLNRDRLVRLVYVTAGVAVAGSGTRQDAEKWGVRFEACGATHGQSFSGDRAEARARALFDHWTRTE